MLFFIIKYVCIGMASLHQGNLQPGYPLRPVEILHSSDSVSSSTGTYQIFLAVHRVPTDLAGYAANTQTSREENPDLIKVSFFRKKTLNVFNVKKYHINTVIA
jgi:hypothetical protein